MSDLLNRYAREAGYEGDTFTTLAPSASMALLRASGMFLHDGCPHEQIEHALADLPAEDHARVRKQMERGLPVCESPIERRLLPWLLCQRYGCFDHRPQILLAGESESLPPYTVAVVPQLVIGRHRVDFALAARREGPIRFVIVECDGAEFHQNVRRDIDRDAYLLNQRRVLDITFFSGSEIWRHPATCAREASAALTQAWSSRNHAADDKFARRS